MAGVIKERVSFRNTTIGVVRAPTAAVEAWRGAYESANQLTNQAYKMAAVEARKKGIEVAEQLEREQIRTINPETGKPEAMSLLPTGLVLSLKTLTNLLLISVSKNQLTKK
jgi:hypothetical protein